MEIRGKKPVTGKQGTLPPAGEKVGGDSQVLPESLPEAEGGGWRDPAHPLHQDALKDHPRGLKAQGEGRSSLYAFRLRGEAEARPLPPSIAKLLDAPEVNAKNI